MDQGVLLLIGIGAAGLLVGLGVGLVLRRPDGRLRERVKTLEADLQEAQRRHDAHRARVEKHFERTSDLFRDLTEQYTALYTHLAEGARELCPEGGPALGRGFNDPLLAASFGDLAEEMPGRGLPAAAPPESATGPEDTGDEAEAEDEPPEASEKPPWEKPATDR